MYISLHALAGSILFCLVVVICVLVIMTLFHLLTFIKKVKFVVDENSQSISKTLKIMPEIIENYNEVILILKDILNKISQLIDFIQEKLFSIGTVCKNTNSIFDFVEVVSSIAKIVSNGFYLLFKRK